MVEKIITWYVPTINRFNQKLLLFVQRYFSTKKISFVHGLNHPLFSCQDMAYLQAWLQPRDQPTKSAKPTVLLLLLLLLLLLFLSSPMLLPYWALIYIYHRSSFNVFSFHYLPVFMVSFLWFSYISPTFITTIFRWNLLGTYTLWNTLMKKYITFNSKRSSISRYLISYSRTRHLRL